MDKNANGGVRTMNIFKNSNILMISLILISLAAIFAFSIDSASAAPNQIYVNNATGNDAWDGQNPTWNGTSGPKLSIKNATGTVNANGTVNVANGVYSGVNNLNISINKNMTILGESSTGTIIDAGGLGRVFTVNNGFNLIIQSLTIRNGRVSGNGGAILNNGGTLTVNNTNFVNNRVSSSNNDGGAIYNTGRLTVNNGNFTGNSAMRNGGAIWSGSSLSGVTLNVTRTNFISNTAGSNGGAIHNNAGNAVIHLNRIIGNSPGGNQIRRSGGNVNIINNWWGDNAGSTGKTSGTVTATTWLVLTVTASQTWIPTSGTSTITANLNYLNNGSLATGGSVPDGIPVTFTGTLGSVNPVSATTLNGISTTTFTGSNPGIATLNATVDSVNVGTSITVGNDIYVSPTGNDTTGDGSYAKPYRTIAKGISMVYPEGTVRIANGTYTGTGNVNLTINKNMTIIGESRDSTIIDGQNTNQIFIISNGYNVTLTNLTLRYGLASNSNGGAIQNNGSSLTINNCALTNNMASRTADTTAVYGGAIYNTGTLTITNSIFTGNTAVSGSLNDAFGGAIYSTGSMTITGSTFTNNSVNSSSGTANDDGGAIYTNGNLNIDKSSFTSNIAGQDGGAIYSNSNLIITSTSFTSNTAAMTNEGAGGAICIGDRNILGMILTITNSSFTSNRGLHGGALWTNAGNSTNPATITNTTFTGNTGTHGGVIRNWGILNITGSNFTGNSATNGGAINNYNSGRSSLTVTESSLMNNSATSGGAVYNEGGTADIRFNRITGNSGTDIYRASGTVNAQNNWWGTNFQGTTPLAAGRVNSGVNVPTWLVLRISAAPAAIHSGETSVITASLTYDQNGNYYNPASGHVPDGILITFTSILGTIPDASTVNGIATTTFTAGSKPGIATVSATVDSQTLNTQITIGRDDVYVSPTGDDTTGDGSRTNPLKTIAAGIAGVYPSGTVHIANGTYNEHDLTINKDMTIVGAGQANTTVNAEGNGRIFTVNSGITLTIQNLTLVNGNANYGGAILNYGDLTVENCTFTDNTATQGGAIFSGGPLTVKNCTFTNNKATGSGATFGGAIYNSNVSTVNDSTFTGNSATYGGAIYNQSVLTINNGTITGNSASQGGAIYNDYGADLNITSSNLLNNTATGTGGTIYNTGTAIINFNRIIGTGNVIASPDGSVNALNNWWGSNDNPSSKVSGNVNVSKWIVLTVTASQTNVSIGGTSTIIADLRHNNLGEDTLIVYGKLVPANGLLITFANDALGALTITNGNLDSNNQAITVFTGLASGLSTVNVTVDSQTTPVQIKIGTVDLRVRNYEWYSGRNNNYNYNEAPPYVSYVRNYGPDDATNIVVSYKIGDGLIYQGYNLWYGVNRASYDELTRTLTYYVDYLPSNATAAIIIYLKVNATGTQTPALTTNASLVSVDQTESGTYANSEVRRLTVANAADIQVNQNINGVTGIQTNTNDNIILTITVTNNGPNTASGIQIEDLLTGLTYLSNDGGATYDSGTRKLTWIISSLASGGSISLHITVKADIIGTYKPFANKTNSTPYDWNPANNVQTNYITRT